MTTAGEAAVYERTGESGGKISFHFCPACGSTVYYTIDAMPGTIAIPIGAFADADFPQPKVSVYEARRHAWAGAVVTTDGQRAPVNVAAALDATAAWDLVLVSVLASHVEAVLPALTASRAKAVMFMFNTFESLEPLREAVGHARFAFGFPAIVASDARGLSPRAPGRKHRHADGDGGGEPHARENGCDALVGGQQSAVAAQGGRRRPRRATHADRHDERRCARQRRRCSRSAPDESEAMSVARAFRHRAIGAL